MQINNNLTISEISTDEGIVKDIVMTRKQAERIIILVSLTLNSNIEKCLVIIFM